MTTERAISRHDALIRVCRYAPPHRLTRIIVASIVKGTSRGGEIGVIREVRVFDAFKK